MLILLTNDDGIAAEGLAAMRRELLRLGEVHVVAPASVQSATGHGITLAAPLMTHEASLADGAVGVAVEGRPADCVKLAVARLLPRQPDLVVSGINAGANVGINVIYSGTVAAAIEAAFLGLPAVASSLLLKAGVTPDFDVAAAHTGRVIDRLLACGLPRGTAASINLPPLTPSDPPPATKFVRQCTRPWVDTYESRRDPRGRRYFWNSSVFTLGASDGETDVTALRDGCITVTPLQFDLTDRALLRKWEQVTADGPAAT